MRLKASWTNLICHTHQHYHRHWLPNTDWSNSRRSAWARDRWLWRERLWEKESFEMSMENALKNANKWSKIRVWWWRRAGWWWRIRLIRNTKSRVRIFRRGFQGWWTLWGYGWQFEGRIWGQALLLLSKMDFETFPTKMGMWNPHFCRTLDSKYMCRNLDCSNSKSNSTSLYKNHINSALGWLNIHAFQINRRQHF